MKAKVILTIIFLGLIHSLQSQSSGETKVAQAVESLRQAMVNADATILGNLTSEFLSYGHSSGTIEDKTTYILAITSKKNEFKSIEQVN